MGMADFYLNIHIYNSDNSIIENIYQHLNSTELFLSTCEKKQDSWYISMECKFDNMLPSLMFVYDVISEYDGKVKTIETSGVVCAFDFNDIASFVKFVFSVNINKITAYYEQMGYFSIDSRNYYKKRIRLNKYYKKYARHLKS